MSWLRFLSPTIQWVLETGYCHVLIQTAALMTSPCPGHKHDCPLLFGWNCVVWLSPKLLCFPFTEPAMCMNTRFIFKHTHTSAASRIWGDVHWIWKKSVLNLLFPKSLTLPLNWLNFVNHKRYSFKIPEIHLKKSLESCIREKVVRRAVVWMFGGFNLTLTQCY